MTVVNKFNVNKQEVTLDSDIIENMSANDVLYDASTQYDENTVGEKLSELGSKVDAVNASSLKWLLSDTTMEDAANVPTAVLDVFSKSEITEDLYLTILGARYSDIKDCVCQIKRVDNSIVETIHFDATGKKYMQIECAGLVFLLYVPNLKVNSYDIFPSYKGLHLNTIKRYVDADVINTIMRDYFFVIPPQRFSAEGSDTSNSRFSYTVKVDSKKLYIKCHKVLGYISNYNIYLKNSQTSSLTLLVENCAFDKYYFVEITEDYDSVLLYSSNYNKNGVEIDCYFTPPKNIDFMFERVYSEIKKVSPLYGKKIACFGDSITEFKYESIGYCDWLAEYTGATVYNFGIGGTRIAQRTEPSSSPTDSNTAYAGVDICNMVKSFCSRDFSIVDECALYLKEQVSDDNVAIVSRMKSITPEEIDIVTIFGGTNDFTGGSVIGELGSTDNGTIYGGLDNMINYLLTANPKLKIYIFTPIVRYFSNIRDEEHWSDNVVSTNSNLSGKTLPDIADLIEKMAKYRHIPCNNWYWTLGWNQFNFSSYFLDNDSTHPYKGFSFLAQKMKSFIESNF